METNNQKGKTKFSLTHNGVTVEIETDVPNFGLFEAVFKQLTNKATEEIKKTISKPSEVVVKRGRGRPRKNRV
jgi:hypothetical protein